MNRRLITKETGVVPEKSQLKKRSRHFNDEDDDVILYKRSSKRNKINNEYDDEYDYEEDEEGEEEIEEDED